MAGRSALRSGRATNHMAGLPGAASGFTRTRGRRSASMSACQISKRPVVSPGSSTTAPSEWSSLNRQRTFQRRSSSGPWRWYQAAVPAVGTSEADDDEASPERSSAGAMGGDPSGGTSTWGRDRDGRGGPLGGGDTSLVGPLGSASSSGQNAEPPGLPLCPRPPDLSQTWSTPACASASLAAKPRSTNC